MIGARVAKEISPQTFYGNRQHRPLSRSA